jgi:hypothetical protein
VAPAANFVSHNIIRLFKDSRVPLRIGLVLYPLVPMALVLLRRGPVSKFYRAGAISPQTARRPKSVEAEGDLQSAVRNGVLIDLDDGRYFVDVPAYRRRCRRINWAIGLLVAFGLALGILAWVPWR